MVFFKPTVLAVLSITGIVALTACNAQETGKNVAIVNGVPIPQARMDFVVKMQQAQGQKDSEETRKQLREALVSREIVTQEAIKKGLDKSVDYQTQMDLAKQQVLVNAYLEDYLKTHEPTEVDLKAEYEAVKKGQYDPNGKEYKVRHILIKTPTKDDPKAQAAAKKKADGILAQLQKGAKFDELAKKNSDDAGSKAKGGELDWTDGANLVKPFAEAMKALGKGETSKAPVRTQYGFHIIRLDDVRPVEFPPFDQVKDEVSKQLLAKQRDKLIEDLRKAAKVE